MSEFFGNEVICFYTLLLLCLILLYLPVVGKYLRLLGTMLHEGGHVLMALLLGEKPKKVQLFKDTSGQVTVSTSASWKALLVSLAGYPSTALAAFGSFYMINHGYTMAYIWIVMALTALFIVFYIRNVFGFFWSLFFLFLHAFLVYKQLSEWIDIIVHIDAFVLFVDAVYSCFVLIYLAFTKPKNSGDAANVAKITHIPAQFTAIVFFLFNVFMDFLTVKHFFPLEVFFNNI